MDQLAKSRKKDIDGQWVNVLATTTDYETKEQVISPNDRLNAY
jgi:hypothetical protein